MIKTNKNGNKLCLGTVQMGQQYGIKNELGRKPRLEESFLVLQAAVDSGIDCFDTASVYGDAEEILGGFGISRFPVKVISKMRAGGINGKNEVIEELCISLNRLHLKSLYGYLLHSAKDLYSPEILRGLTKAKEAGLTEHIGVSIYEPEDALYAVQSHIIDIIQIPYNVFDQRLDKTDFFEMAEQNHIQVYARSAFLQGLLLMEPDALPSNLQTAQSYLREFREICEQYHFSVLEASLLYSYCHPGISYVVFGVDTVEQLKSNLNIIEKSDDFCLCYKKLYGAFYNIERKLIVPSLWNI